MKNLNQIGTNISYDVNDPKPLEGELEGGKKKKRAKAIAPIKKQKTKVKKPKLKKYDMQATYDNFEC